MSGSSMDIHMQASGTINLAVDCSGIYFTLSGKNVNGVDTNACVKGALE